MPLLSLESAQLRVTPTFEAIALKLPGIVGAWVSEPPAVVAGVELAGVPVVGTVDGEGVISFTGVLQFGGVPIWPAGQVAGGGGAGWFATVTLTLRVADPAEFAHVSVKVVLFVSGPLDTEPVANLLPPKVPPAPLQTVGLLATLHDSVEDAP